MEVRQTDDGTHALVLLHGNHIATVNNRTSHVEPRLD